MKFIDICAGIGGMRLGLEQAGHECIGYCEIDKHARRAYAAMFNTEGEWTAHDITAVRAEDIPRADLWCFGFPCQDISIAGKQAGLAGARSGLYFKILDLVKGQEEGNRPDFLLVENVKRLLSIHDGWDFHSVLNTLDEAGYHAQWQVLNSADFGVPQNRERVFIVGHFGKRRVGEIFPIKRKSGETSGAIKQIGNVAEEKNFKNPQGGRVYDPAGLSPTLDTMQGGGHEPKIIVAGKINSSQDGVVVSAEGIAPTHSAGHGNCPKVAIIDDQGRANKELRLKTICPTLRAQTHGNEPKVMTGSVKIRKLTPRECFRLQGFPDKYFDRAQAVTSDSQLYKQAGNAVTVNVARAIGEKLAEVTK